MIVTAAAMVVVGVTLETVWGIRVDNVVDQMRLEMGPRTELLYGVRREKLEARIRRFKGQHVETRYCSQYDIPPFNEEAMGVALILPFVLKEAGWNAPDADPRTLRRIWYINSCQRRSITSDPRSCGSTAHGTK